MSYTILFKRENTITVDPLMGKIRAAARAEGWSRMVGFKDWAKETYNATLRSGKYDDWTSISFKTEESMKKFKQDFGVEE
jgi:hypothetical protein